ncbi:MAG TPA: universal stress protein [Anaerolineales bacterium]|nr:universal stress protein [Anaerolineales bacterium]
MFKNILVPLDGSKLSESALQPASVLARRLKSHVMLLHVIEEDAPAEIHKEHHLTDPEEATAYLSQVAARAFPADVPVETHVHRAPVADVATSIVEHAMREFEPDLIVTCTHGRGGMRDMLFGSIAQQIVSQGSTPLLLIRPDSRPFKVARILTPLDPDSIHDDGLPLTESLAQRFGAELDLLSVVPTYNSLTGEQAATSSLMPSTAHAVLDMREESAREHLAEHLEALQERGIEATAEVARGDPAAVILKASEESQADIIVLSTHGKAGVGAFWARSVAPHVAQRTKTPLLLIPLPPAE